MIKIINIWRQESISFSPTSPYQVPVAGRIVAQGGYLKTGDSWTTFPPCLYTEFLAPPHPMSPISQFSDHLGGAKIYEFLFV